MKNGYLDGSSLPERIGLASDAIRFHDGEEREPPSRIPVAISAEGRRRRRTWREMHEAPRGHGFGNLDRYFARRATLALLATEPSSDLEDDIIAAIDAKRFSAADLLAAIDLEADEEPCAPPLREDDDVFPWMGPYRLSPGLYHPALVARIVGAALTSRVSDALRAEIRADPRCFLARSPASFDDSDGDPDPLTYSDEEREAVERIESALERDEAAEQLYRRRPRERRIDPKMRPLRAT